MPRLFHGHGFAWLDLRDVHAIPCRASNFVDGGYHTNAACSMVPCADVYHAFNGPDGTSFDGAFVAGDHIHPNQYGHRVIANLLVELGFAPFAR